MEDTSQPKEFISARTRGKTFVALGLLLMVGMGILSVILVPDMFENATTFTSREKVFSIALLILIFMVCAPLRRTVG